MFKRTNREIEHILNTVVDITADGCSYNLFENSVGQRWLFPAKSAGISLNLFSPNTFKGRFFKILLPYVRFSSLLKKFLGVANVKIRLSDSFHSFICNLFLIDTFDFAIFEGSPCAHQKITIQIYKGDVVYGYCKLSMKQEVIDIFRSEQTNLNNLTALAHDLHIPKCLYCGEVDGVECFVQTTELTKNSKILNEFTEFHWTFIRSLYDATHVKIDFKDSDFYLMLSNFKQLLDGDTSSNAQYLKSQIEEVLIELENRCCDFSYYHGDFTPWNCFLEQQNLFVYDFEYLRKTYPPYMDYFHFLTQSCIYQKRMCADDIFELYKRGIDRIERLVRGANKSYRYYLLHIIYFYMFRERGSHSEMVNRDVSTWIELLKLLNIND